MNKIYFDDISNFRKNWIMKSIVLIGIFSIFIGFFYSTMNEIEPIWVKIIKSVGFLFLSIFFISKVIRKNYVQCNKFGMTVRINNYFREKRITFYEVNSYEFINDRLRIIQSNKTIELDLNNILESDKKRLIKIIEENTVANTS